MNDEGKVLGVEDPVELAERGVQGHLLEGVVRRLLNRVVRHHLSLHNDGELSQKIGRNKYGTYQTVILLGPKLILKL